MTSQNLADAKAGARAVLEIFDPQYQHVGLAVLGAGSPANPCNDLHPSYGGEWLAVPLSSDYKNPDGTLNTSSDLVSTINCLGHSSQGTNLGSPLNDDEYGAPDALAELLSSTRGVKQGIIYMTDGAANEPDPLPGPDNPCGYALTQALLVKNQDIEIFTIGYGMQNEFCNDESGSYGGQYATVLLANMATDSADEHGHCITTLDIQEENNDGDHFLCQAKGSDLEIVFIQAASALAPGIRLIGEP
jgi:hypothetical protein